MRCVVEKNLKRGEALSRVFTLSNRILAGDTKSTLGVVVDSLNEWDVDWLNQKHRTYYKARQDRTPNKIILSRPALLQYIACKQTTKYEIAQETAFLSGRGRLTQRMLLLRYVKFLLHESSSRSFNVAVGVSRILHKYDHATTKRFYAVLDQRDQELLVEGQPDNKTDDEYRRCKMILVDKLEQRFKPFVSVARGPRNEKRFLPSDQPVAWSTYIRECLGLLTPWETEHILPPEFVPTEFNITKLKCEGRRDEWDSAEENRMHTMIDPECFARLVKACGAPAPEEQLDVPEFKSVGQEPDGGGDQGGGTPELTLAQVRSILDELDERGTRRKVATAEHLWVEVDGDECGQLDTAAGGGLRLDLSPESRQIQVFTADAKGKLLLASLWLNLIDITPDAGWESSIVLEGGQRLGIEIKPVLSPAGELESLAARISYRESDPLRILTHYVQQLRGRVSEHLRLKPALSYLRFLQGVVYGYRRSLAMLLLFATVAISLIPPRPPNHLRARSDVRPQLTDNAGGGRTDAQPLTSTKSSGPDRNIARGLQVAAADHESRFAGALQTFGQGRKQVAFSPDGAVLTSIDGGYVELWEQALKTSGTYPPNPQRSDYYALLDLNAVDWESGVVRRDASFFPANDKRLLFFTAHDDFANWTFIPSLTGLSTGAAPSEWRVYAQPLAGLDATQFTLFDFSHFDGKAINVWGGNQFGARPAGLPVLGAARRESHFLGLPLTEAELRTAGIRTLDGGFNGVLKEFGSVPEDPSVGARLPQYPLVHLSSHFTFTAQSDWGRLVGAESISPDSVSNADRGTLRFWLVGHPDAAAQPLLRNRPRAGIATMTQRTRASNRAREAALTAFEQANQLYRTQLDVDAEVFDLFNFNDDNHRRLGLRQQSDVPLIWLSGADMSRVQRLNAANFVEPNQTTSRCGNRTSGSNAPCWQLEVKFKF